MAEKINVVAVDGPAGSGKSTIARNVAGALGFLYIDTGAMYRALTLKALKKNIDLCDEKKLAALAGDTDIKLDNEGGSSKVLLDMVDVSGEIRKLYVSENVKYVACLPAVRARMVAMQRDIGKSSSGACLEGRDIGTVVFPEAKFKFYLDADFETRVMRRLKEMESKGMVVTREEVAKDLHDRDFTDKVRKHGPLKQAQDAVYVDTTRMTIDEVTGFILARIGMAG